MIWFDYGYYFALFWSQKHAITIHTLHLPFHCVCVCVYRWFMDIKVNKDKQISYHCHCKWCEMNRSVNVQKIVPVLLMSICVQAEDNVNYFSLKMLCGHLDGRPFVVHQSRVVYVQRCKPVGACARACMVCFFEHQRLVIIIHWVFNNADIQAVTHAGKDHR